MNQRAGKVSYSCNVSQNHVLVSAPYFLFLILHSYVWVKRHRVADIVLIDYDVDKVAALLSVSSTGAD